MSTEPPIATHTAAAPTSRQALRLRLHASRDSFIARADHREAESALSLHLANVLNDLSPELLGLYWPVRSEFNAAAACVANEGLGDIDFALPFARRDPHAMDYRSWDRRMPTLRDECGLPAVDGSPVVPDVVLAPCLGFTADGLRVGYGGGYFDRWLAAHPHVTAIGVAWSATEIERSALDPQPHDRPLMMIVTELGVVTG